MPKPNFYLAGDEPLHLVRSPADCLTLCGNDVPADPPPDAKPGEHTLCRECRTLAAKEDPSWR